MPTLQIDADLPPQKLLEAVKQLNSSELDEFTKQVVLLRAQRRTPHLSQRETELLQKINIGISSETLEPYRELKKKRDLEQLNQAEHEELLRLNNSIEKFNVERIGFLVELAQLRNQPLQLLMDELGIRPQNV
jgi:hypothetical protein